MKKFVLLLFLLFSFFFLDNVYALEPTQEDIDTILEFLKDNGYTDNLVISYRDYTDHLEYPIILIEDTTTGSFLCYSGLGGLSIRTEEPSVYYSKYVYVSNSKSFVKIRNFSEIAEFSEISIDGKILYSSFDFYNISKDKVIFEKNFPLEEEPEPSPSPEPSPEPIVPDENTEGGVLYEKAILLALCCFFSTYVFSNLIHIRKR